MTKKVLLAMLLICAIFCVTNTLIYTYQQMHHSFNFRHDPMPPNFLKELDDKMENMFKEGDDDNE